nr:MAG TPA: hypothetical protein [Caudoviricetes sp.]
MIKDWCIIIHDLLWKVSFSCILFHHGCISRNMQIVFLCEAFGVVTNHDIC